MGYKYTIKTKLKKFRQSRPVVFYCGPLAVAPPPPDETFSMVRLQKLAKSPRMMRFLEALDNQDVKTLPKGLRKWIKLLKLLDEELRRARRYLERDGRQALPWYEFGFTLIKGIYYKMNDINLVQILVEPKTDYLLHAAVGVSDGVLPEHFVDVIVECFLEDQVLVKGPVKNRLPLAEAAASGASPTVLKKMVTYCPETRLIQDDDGLYPFDLALKRGGGLENLERAKRLLDKNGPPCLIQFKSAKELSVEEDETTSQPEPLVASSSVTMGFVAVVVGLLVQYAKLESS